MKNKHIHTDINVVIPMAGEGKRFSDKGYSIPKPLLPVGRNPMIKAVIENLFDPGFKFTLIINSKQINTDEIKKVLDLCDIDIIEIDYLTKGPAATCLLSKDKINNNIPLIIVNCDQIIEDFNFRIFYRFVKYNNLDGAIGAFHSSSPKNSYIRVSDDNQVIEVKEKQMISNIATNGFHYWEKGTYFFESATDMIKNNDTVNGEFYVAPTYNYMIKQGMKIMPFHFNMHFPIGIPQDYETYCSKNIIS